MINFIDQNQKSREEFIIAWVKIIRENKKDWEKDHTSLINAQILQAREFYDNLLKTKGGAKKIIKKFNITNKEIIKRLKDENSNAKPQKLIKPENKKFIRL